MNMEEQLAAFRSAVTTALEELSIAQEMPLTANVSIKATRKEFKTNITMKVEAKGQKVLNFNPPEADPSQTEIE